MIKEFIGTGKTVAEATAAAKAGLNAPALADINVEVIVMPKGKVLGIFGGRDAQVKAWYDDGKKERKPQQKKEPRNKDSHSTPPKKQQPKKEAVKKETIKKEAAHSADKPIAEAQKPQAASNAQLTGAEVDEAIKYLKGILSGFNMEDTVVTGDASDGVLRIQIECEDHGIIIGRRGETLDALQYLTGLAVKKTCDKYVKVSINVGNYRERRTESLSNIARKNAAYVLKTGRRYTFDPMNPYERRIIHTTIQEIEGVESISVGSGDNRRVMLQSTDGPRPRRSGSSPRSAASKPAARTAAPKSDRADLPKFGKIEVKKD